MNEVLGFEPAGDGEHVLLHIEKRGQNTRWVASLIAKLAGVREQDIGFCGRKDRHAVTRQWFSVYLPHRPTVDWAALGDHEGVRVLVVSRHQKKLRLGGHQANEFCIRLRDVESIDNGIGLSDNEKKALSDQLHELAVAGVPNYFGEQRFGNGGANLTAVEQWFVEGKSPGRQNRAMVLSAARSYLFNQVLAARVQNDTWNRVLSGDSSSDLPTGPLWGRGRPLVREETLALESDVLEDFSVWCERLEHLGLKQERRDLVLFPELVSSEWQDNDWLVRFRLPTGAFATTVLDAIIKRSQ